MFLLIFSKWMIFRYASFCISSCWGDSDKISSLQYTVNGKKIEIAVKQIVSGSNLKPSGTVANPESLKLYYKYRDIEAVIDVPKQMAKL